MADPRVEKLARVMVQYSLELQPRQQFWLRTTPLAEEAVRAGAHVHVDQHIPGADEIFYKYASDEQLEYVPPVRKMLFRREVRRDNPFCRRCWIPGMRCRNESGLHWDMLCDMAESEITVDGELFYKNGRTVVG